MASLLCTPAPEWGSAYCKGLIFRGEVFVESAQWDWVPRWTVLFPNLKITTRSLSRILPTGPGILSCWVHQIFIFHWSPNFARVFCWGLCPFLEPSSPFSKTHWCLNFLLKPIKQPEICFLNFKDDWLLFIICIKTQLWQKEKVCLKIFRNSLSKKDWNAFGDMKIAIESH